MSAVNRGRGKRSEVLDAVEVVVFHPCASLTDFRERKRSFSPSFAHHFFGDEQKIVAGPNVRLRLFFTVGSFFVYPVIDDPSVCLSEERRQKIREELNSVPFPGGFVETEEEFEDKIKEQGDFEFLNSEASGGENKNKVTSFVCQGNHRIEVFRLSLENPEEGTQEGGDDDSESSLFSLHRRLEWFLHWFIDAVSEIEHTERWNLYLALMPLHVGEAEGEEGREDGEKGDRANKKQVCALVTTYKFFGIPLSRVRISQFFVFPEWQGKGVGLELLDAVLDVYAGDESIQEVTVEDAAPEFAILRNTALLRRALRTQTIPTEAIHPGGSLFIDKAVKALAAEMGQQQNGGGKQDGEEGDETRPRKRLRLAASDDDDSMEDGEAASKGPTRQYRKEKNEPAKLRHLFIRKMKVPRIQARRLEEAVRLASLLPNAPDLPSLVENPYKTDPLFEVPDAVAAQLSEEERRGLELQGPCITVQSLRPALVRIPPVGPSAKQMPSATRGPKTAPKLLQLPPPSPPPVSASAPAAAAAPRPRGSVGRKVLLEDDEEEEIVKSPPKAQKAAAASSNSQGQENTQGASNGAGGAGKKNKKETGAEMIDVDVDSSDGQAEGEGDFMQSVRLDVKKRLRKEYAEDLHGLDQTEVKRQLEGEWVSLYTGYTRSIMKLRRLFPLPSILIE